MLEDSEELKGVEENSTIAFPDKQTYLFLHGNVGKIELLVSPKKPTIDSTAKNIIAIICHPHPLHAGTMDNKVVFTLHKAFSDYGCSTVRFNFRGVGRTEGVHDNGLGETDDLLTIVRWVKSTNPNCEIILAGFSFGAFISFKASKIINCKLLVSVAPVIHHQNYQDYLPLSCPWLAITAEHDEIIPPQMIAGWMQANSVDVTLINISDCDHFFHGQLPVLKSSVIQSLIERF